MSTNGEGKVPEKGISRRDFLKTGAFAAAAAAAGAEIAVNPSAATAAAVAETYHTTCPYCSASCGQLVDVDSAGNVLDVYGDFKSPMNAGGLCSKGAGSYQLVTNPRRLGAFPGPHPENPKFAYDSAPAYANGIAYKRTGNADWDKIPLDQALNEIAQRMVTARGPVNPANGHNSKSVAFFGSSHLNNEQNYSYRRLIAQFGTSNVEHQARL
ncbi:MAG: twin-arginine translocation signal domain-containing protein [Actinobacteria bacterium]|nr:twin-arginine translocation signal domain-containing protein [Actinomycetota bacterium]